MSAEKEVVLRRLVATWRDDARMYETRPETDPSLRAVDRAAAVMLRASANQLEIVLGSAL